MTHRPSSARPSFCWFPSRQPSGSVLIIVVWAIGLLSLLVAGFASRCLAALALTDRLEGQLQAAYAARSEIQQDLTVLAAQPPSLPNSLREGWMDEERKIHLNTASGDILQRLLKQVGGLRDDSALALADSIQDWRDKDQDKRPYGAENFYYLGLEDSYECKDGPFENVEELLFVKGMTPELLDRLIPYVTVYGSGRININTAGRPVLQALGLSREGIDGIVFYRAGEDNKEGTGDDHVLDSLTSISSELSRVVPKEDLNRLEELIRQRLLTVRSSAFGFSVTARGSGRETSRLQVECVADRSGRILQWSER